MSHPTDVYWSGIDINSGDGLRGGPSCYICHKMFAVRASLLAHIAGVHYKSKMYKCQFCGMQFAYKTNVYRHRKTCKSALKDVKLNG